MPTVLEHGLVFRDDGMPDVTEAERITCDCGKATAYIVDRVERGYADVMVTCAFCLTATAMAASKLGEEATDARDRI